MLVWKHFQFDFQIWTLSVPAWHSILVWQGYFAVWLFAEMWRRGWAMGAQRNALNTSRNVLSSFSLTPYSQCFHRVHSSNCSTPLVIFLPFFFDLSHMSLSFLNLISAWHWVPGAHCLLKQNLHLYSPRLFFSKPYGSVFISGMRTYFPCLSCSTDARLYAGWWCGGSGQGGGPGTGNPTTAVMEVFEEAGVGALAMAVYRIESFWGRNRNLTRYFWTKIVVGAQHGKI